MCFHFYRVKHFISSKQILQIDICKRHLDFFKVNYLLSPSSACRFVCFPVTDLDNQRIKKKRLLLLFSLKYPVTRGYFISSKIFTEFKTSI